LRFDKTTPSGEFKVDEIIPSSYWTHDFDDENGEIKGAYGPWGDRYSWKHDPNSIGTLASKGCIE
jgi:hypothetical protein